MLTHSIRALTLLVLIAIAHTVKPFSVANLTSFALTTAASLTQVLPEQTLGKLEKAGLLAVVVTGNWTRNLAGEGLLSNRFSHQMNAAAQQTVAAATQTPHRAARTGQAVAAFRKASRLIAQHETLFGRSGKQVANAPLPTIPGLHLSLLPNTMLRVQSQMPLAAEVLPQTKPSRILVSPVLNEADCAPAELPKESSWTSEEVFFGPISSAFQPQTIQWHVVSQRPVSGTACAQPVQGTQRSVRVSRQSC